MGLYKRNKGLFYVKVGRHKVRLVAKKYKQREGNDYYTEVFSPMVRHASI